MAKAFATMSAQEREDFKQDARIKQKSSFNLKKDIAEQGARRLKASGKVAAAAALKKKKQLRTVNASSLDRTSTAKTAARRKLTNVQRAKVRKGTGHTPNGTALDRKTLGV